MFSVFSVLAVFSVLGVLAALAAAFFEADFFAVTFFAVGFFAVVLLLVDSPGDLVVAVVGWGWYEAHIEAFIFASPPWSTSPCVGS